MSGSGGQVVLTAHPHGCLLLYPVAAWEPIRDKVLAASSLDRHAASIKRLLVGHACEETLDAAGRLLISPELRRFARFEKQVSLAGMGSHFEIWASADWQQQEDIFQQLGNQPLPHGLEDLAL